MKILLGAVFVGILFGLFTGAIEPSGSSLPDFASTTLVDTVDDAVDFCREAVESIISYYENFMETSEIVSFFKYHLPPDQNPGTVVLVGCGLVGLVGFGWRKRRK